MVSCCVDEVGCTKFRYKNQTADAVIHFGHACLSPTNRLPVKFVFGRQDIDVNDCVDQLKLAVSDINAPILLLYDVVYHHSIGKR